MPTPERGATPTPPPDATPTGAAASSTGRNTPTPEPVADDLPQPTIAQALAYAMSVVGAVGKDSRNEQQRFNFRGVDAVVNACSPALARAGVVVAPKVLSVERSTTQTRAGGTVSNVYVTVRYRFTGPAGDHIDATVAAESFDSGDKATAKAMSVAYRTALLQTLCLPTDEPTDPDAHTFERGPAEPARQPQRTTAAEARQQGRQPAAPAAAPGVPPLPPATAMAYRQRIIDSVHATAPGAERDAELRTIRDELATIDGALATQVPVPEAWQRGRGEYAPLSGFIGAVRGERARAFPAESNPDDDPWSTPEGAAAMGGNPA